MDNRVQVTPSMIGGKSTKREKAFTTRSASTTAALRAAILAGEFAPGERIYEQGLSERLQVSRTPIREALKSLAGEGLLDHVPNRGYYVRQYSLDDIIEAYEIRGALEGLAARRAAQHGLGAEERAIIEKALQDGEVLLEKSEHASTDRVLYGEINSAFHGAILAGSRSRMLRDQIRHSQQIAPSAHRNVVAFERRDVRRRHDDHHRIYEAILCRDAGRAELLMRDHVESVKIALIRSMSREW